MATGGSASTFAWAVGIIPKPVTETPGIHAINSSIELRASKEFLIAVIVLQSLFWLYANQMLKFELPPGIQVTSAAFAAVDTPAMESLETAQWRVRNLPWTACCDERHFAVRYQFSMERAPAEDQAILHGVLADNYHSYLNGHAVRRLGRLAPQSTYHNALSRLDPVPAEFFNAGSNELIILTARNMNPYTDFGALYLAPYPATRDGTARRQFVLNELRLTNAIVAALVAMAALVLIRQIRNRRFASWLMLLCMVWCLRILFYRWYDPPMSPAFRYVYYFALTLALPLAWLGFVNAWSSWNAGRVWQFVLMASLGSYVLCLAAITFLFLSNQPNAFDVADTITNAFSLIVLLFAAVRLGNVLLPAGRARPWETAAFLLCMTAIGIDVLNEVLWQRPGVYTELSAPVFLIALLTSLIARNVQVFENLNDFNASLRQTLAEREQEIERRLEQQQQAERAQELAEERQSLLRDLHDGLGSNLVGLLAMARTDQADIHQLTWGLEQTLEDLRLTLDSLDTAGEDLAMALGAFRERTEPSLSSAGYRLEWDTDRLPDGLMLAPKVLLNVYRILQEGVANTLKHAGGDRIRLQADTSDEMVHLQLCDNGRPRASDNESLRPDGYGLRSMRQRAAEIGGELTIRHANPGVCLELAFPASVHDDAAPPKNRGSAAANME